MTEGRPAPAPLPVREPVPQPVLAPLTANAIFLVLTIEPGGEATVRDLLGDWAGLQRAVGFRAPAPPLACVAGIGSNAWDRLFSGRARPDCTRSVSSPGRCTAPPRRRAT